MFLPDDFVTSNVDLAASIFYLAGIDLPDGYQMDGEPFIEDVAKALADPDFDQVEDGDSSCRFKFLDIKNSYSMISGRYQYIFRATDDVDTMYDVDELYPFAYDLEQLYDLENDPNQKSNIFNNGPQMMSLQETVSEFETIMREYIDLHCIATNGAQCVKPDLRFGMTGGGYFVDVPVDPVPSPTDHPVSECFDEEDAGFQCCVDSDCDSDIGPEQICEIGWCVDFTCSSNDDCAADEFCIGETCLHGDPREPTGEPVEPPTPTPVQEEPVDPNPPTPTPVQEEPVDPCAGVVCRGSQVCNN